MSLDITNLHTLIVRAHDQRQIVAIGKIMRVTLQAVANGTLGVSDHSGSPLKFSQPDRDYLDRLASVAEASNEFRWWTKPPWSELQRMFVNETKFWSWLDRELSANWPKAHVAKQTAKRRTSPAKEAASAALKAEYPKGIPGRADEPDSVLVDKIARRLTIKFGEKFSPKKDSILRAAGRRR
jgi:hypothetical protein